MAVLVSDSFNRADSSSLGTTDSFNGGTAATWVNLLGAISISGNQAAPTDATTTFVSYVESGQSDVNISATSAVASNEYGIDFRIVDANNYLRAEYVATGSGANTLYIQRVQNGASTTLSTKTSVSHANGDIWKVSLSGSTISVYQNGTLVSTVTSTFNQTATKHGIGFWGGTAARFDNFQIEDFSSGGYVTQTPNASTADGIATASNAGVIGQQATPGTAAGVSSTNDTTPITLQQANAGPANGSSTGADFTSGAQGANAGPANGQASTADAVPIRIQIANAGQANGTSSSSDATTTLLQQAQAGSADGHANTAWVVPRTGVDIQPDMFKILH